MPVWLAAAGARALAWFVGLPAKVRGWLYIGALCVAALTVAYIAGRRDQHRDTQAHTARVEQQTRETANEAARAAERRGADDSLRAHRF